MCLTLVIEREAHPWQEEEEENRSTKRRGPKFKLKCYKSDVEG